MFHTPLAVFTPGPFELAIIGVVALLLFGKRLPETARGLGRSITEFKKGMKDDGPSDTPPPQNMD